MDSTSVQEFNRVIQQSKLTPPLNQQIEQYIIDLRRQPSGLSASEQHARRTLELIRAFVGCQPWKNPGKLIRCLRVLAHKLIQAKPIELVIGNIFRRILFLVKEDFWKRNQEGQKSVTLDSSVISSSSANRRSPSMAPSTTLPSAMATLSLTAQKSTVTMNQAHSSIGSKGLSGVLAFQKEVDYDSMECDDMRGDIIDAINEQISELENVYLRIAEEALKYIHANEVILVYGKSKSVEALLEYAVQHQRKFEVFVAETADFRGHEMAMRLCKMNIPTTVIPDSAVFAIMARVNKVLIGAHAIVADGGVLGQAGTNMVACAAKYKSIPVVCVAGLYKLCPLYPHNQETFNDVVPLPGLPFNSESFVNAQVLSPLLDYVEPDKIDTYITNDGCYQPPYIYRLLSESYDVYDSDLNFIERFYLSEKN